MYRWIVWLIFLCILSMGMSVTIRASVIEIEDQRYIVTVWAIEDGLPQNSILCLLQTEDGYIWFGTQSGLVRFDGAGFRIYNRWNTKGLKNDWILALYEDTDGSLWIGTNGGGISRLKIEEEEWSSYNVKQGLSNDTVRVIVGDEKGILWIGTDNGLNRLDIKNGTIKNYTVADGLSGFSVTSLSVSPEKDGTLWIGTGGTGINRMEKNRFQPLPSSANLYGRTILSLHEDRSGSLWIGTDYGFYLLEKNEIHNYQWMKFLSNSSVKAILEDSRGNLWIGTDGEGLYRYRKQTGTVNNRTTRQGLPDDFIYSLQEDSQGNIWIGTVTTGLARLKLSRVESITTADGLPENKIHTIIQDYDGYFWVGTRRSGLSKIKIVDNRFNVLQTFTTKNGLPDDRVRTLLSDKEKNLWIGTQGGVAIKKNKTFQTYTTANGLSSNDITAIFQDKSETIWVGTSRGLNQWKDKIFTPFRKQPVLLEAYIRTIGEDHRGNLVVGTTKGIFLFKEKDIQSFAQGHDILAFYEDNSGNLWIGTNGSGIIKFRQENPEQLTFFSTDNGLPNNYIFSIIGDDKDYLWMSSYRGMFRISPIKSTDIDDTREFSFITVVSFDEKEGMENSECVMTGHPSAWKGPDKKLYIPTVKGIAIFDLGIIHSPRPGVKFLPPVKIENVIVDNRSIIREPLMPMLPPQTQIMEFYFTALDFTAPDKVRIFYKLDGFDTRWQEMSQEQKRMAFYLNLPPGDYCFNVIACSNDGVWNREGARFKFKINTFFYKRPVFYILLLGLVLMAGFIFWLLYKRGKKEVQEIKDEQKKEKYKTSALLPETVNQVIPQLKRLMEDEKLFLDPELTLHKLSQRLHVHYNHLSQIINKHMNKSFNDYINSYRIEEARKKLADPREREKTILEIAYDTGFYSKSVFNNAFKKFTGMTPSQYKKTIKQ